MIHINKFYTITLLHTSKEEKKMKSRILATALALTMVLGSTCTVFAASNAQTVDQTATSEEAKSKTVEVKYTVAKTYEVTIPADVVLTSSANYTETKELKADKVLIGENDTLKVTMKSSNASAGSFYLSNGSTKKSTIKYDITVGTDDSALSANTDGNEVLSVTPDTDNTGAASKTVNLKFATSSTEVEKAAQSGDYTDTLTFTVSVATTNQD
jgi:hypothetical protein